jgi:hypothetical protein
MAADFGTIYREQIFNASVVTGRVRTAASALGDLFSVIALDPKATGWT